MTLDDASFHFKGTCKRCGVTVFIESGDVLEETYVWGDHIETACPNCEIGIKVRRVDGDISGGTGTRRIK